MENTLLEYALLYAQLGWPVFPVHNPERGACSCGNSDCSNVGKHPRTQHGCKDASTDRLTIRGWWTEWPNANIGMQTGGELVVLDVDARHGGFQSLADLEEVHGILPPCPLVRTGGGGVHLYFVPNGEHVRNKVGLAQGLDMRGEGGYVVAPPSRHTSGQKYRWSERARIDKIALPPLPAWLFAKATAHSSRGGSHSAMEPITEGNRNNRLASLAGAMRRRGATEETIREALLKENEEHCVPPLPEKEVAAIAHSISKYPPERVPSSQRTSQATEIVRRIEEDVQFFHTADNEPYVTLRINGHFETWRLRDAHFRRWLARSIYASSGKAPSSQALNDALVQLEARALFDGPIEDVFTRLACLIHES